MSIYYVAFAALHVSASESLRTLLCVQVYPDGIRHIRADKRVNEWRPPGKREGAITRAAVNSRQVAIALSGGEIVYFEMDRSGQLNEYSPDSPDKAGTEMPAEITCMGVAEVPPGLQRSRFLAVGCEDNTVRVVSLDPADCMQPLSMQALPAKPVSLCVVEMAGAEGEQSTLYLNIGLENGVLLKAVVDPSTGELSDTRTRYLGSRAIKLFGVRIESADAVLALSSRPWLSYAYQGHSRLTPMSYDMLEHACGFSSGQVPEGIVAIAKNSLRILSVERLGNVFNTTKTPLPRTPRKFAIDTSTGTLVVAEGDHNAVASAAPGGMCGGRVAVAVDRCYSSGCRCLGVRDGSGGVREGSGAADYGNYLRCTCHLLLVLGECTPPCQNKLHTWCMLHSM